MYNNLNFHTVDKVSKKLDLPEEIIMDLIKRNILEAVSVADTGIWIVEEKAVLQFLAKGNNFKNNYSTESVAIKSLHDMNDNNINSKVDKVVCITKKEVPSCTTFNNATNNKIKENSSDLASTNFNNSSNLNIEIDATNLSGKELIDRVIEDLESVNIRNVKENNINKKDTTEPFIANKVTKEKEEVELVVENTFNKMDHTSETSNKNNTSNNILLSKSDIIKHKDGNYVANNKFFTEENVIAEFIFDAEQAKKPVTDEIVLSKLDFNDNVHICDDQEANAELLRKYDKGCSV